MKSSSLNKLNYSDSGLLSFWQRMRFRAQVLQYFLRNVKSLYLFIPVFLAAWLLIFLTLLPPLAPFKNTRLLIQSLPRKDGLKEWKYFGFHSRTTVWGDSLYLADFVANRLKVYAINPQGLVLMRSLQLGNEQLGGAMNLVGESRSPLFYAYSEQNGIRSDYAFCPLTQNFYLLHTHGTDLPAYNLDNEGVQQSSSPYLVFRNELYYYVIRYGFEEKVPSRGIWKLNLASGQRTQILATGAFPEILSYAVTPKSVILFASFGATSNGSSYGGMDDGKGYLLAFDLASQKELWRLQRPGMIYMRPLMTQHPRGKLFKDRYILTYNSFSDYNPDNYYTEEIDPYSGKSLAMYRGINIPARGDDFDRFLEEIQNISLVRPAMFLDSTYATVTAAKDWGSLEDQFKSAIPVFRFKGKTLLIAGQSDHKKKQLRLADTFGRQYLRISPQLSRANEDGTSGEFQSQLFPLSKGGYILCISANGMQKLNTAIHLLQPRKGFELISSFYQDVLYLKQRPGTTVSMMFLLLLALSAMGVMILNRQYHSFKQMAAFFTAPDLVFRTSEEIAELLKARIENTTVVVIRIIGLNALIDAQPSIQAQSQLMDSIMDCLANVCFRKDVVIDKYLNEGIMLLIRNGDRKSSVLTAMRLSDCAKSALRELSQKLRLTTPLQVAIGISYGENLIGLFGSKTKKDYTAVGKYVNLAFRLAYAMPHEGVVTHLEAVEGINLWKKPVTMKIKGFEDNTEYLLVRNGH